MFGVTDGSFVDCLCVGDVESGCQSLSMNRGGRGKEGAEANQKLDALANLKIKRVCVTWNRGPSVEL